VGIQSKMGGHYSEEIVQYKKTKYHKLIYGYARNAETTINQHIPRYLKETILSYYPAFLYVDFTIDISSLY